MAWVVLDVVVAVAGVLVLGALGLRVLIQVQRLSGAVTEAADRIAAAGGDLRRASDPDGAAQPRPTLGV